MNNSKVARCSACHVMTNRVSSREHVIDVSLFDSLLNSLALTSRFDSDPTTSFLCKYSVDGISKTTSLNSNSSMRTANCSWKSTFFDDETSIA